MDKNTVAQSIIAGPINDTGQLALALVINSLAGPDGWLVHTRKDLAKATRTSCLKASRKRIETMVKMGYLEERKKPIPGLRLTEKALSGGWASYPPKWASDPSRWALDPSEQGGPQTHPNGHDTHPSGHLTPAPNPSAYLPKRSKDLKEEDKEKEPSSSPGAGLVLVDTNPTPITPRLDQPAAQPPAIVKQAEGRPDELLPAKPKSKAKRKKPRKNPAHRIPEGWEPKADTIAGLVTKQGIPKEFCEALVWEFQIFWSDRGDARPGWDSTFIRHAKSQWKREQEHAERAKAHREYTDASGKPISEASYLSRENARRVIADMESGILDGFDLDTPV